MFDSCRRFLCKTLKIVFRWQKCKARITLEITLHQLQVMHPLYSQTSLCCALIWFFNWNTIYLITGMEQSIYDKCHHNSSMKMNFNIPLPPPYCKKVWNYKKSNIESMQRAICRCNLDLVSQNKNSKKKIKILTETLMDIFNNCISSKTAKFDFKKPAWMNKEIFSYLKRSVTTLQIIIKIYCLIQQLYAPDFIWQPKKKVLTNWVLNVKILKPTQKPTGL